MTTETCSKCKGKGTFTVYSHDGKLVIKEIPYNKCGVL